MLEYSSRTMPPAHAARALRLHRVHEDKANFSTASTRDAAARRDAKIARFREEKELKRKLEVRALALSTFVCFSIAAAMFAMSRVLTMPISICNRTPNWLRATSMS